MHRPLCEDCDKIPDGGTSTYILHLSGFDAEADPDANPDSSAKPDPEPWFFSNRDSKAKQNVS
jgi:hypothetical protein